jgi:hypothetical protein
MGKFKCSSSTCGKTFLIPAKVMIERKPKDFFSETSRVVVERACCPFCEGLEFEEASS